MIGSGPRWHRLALLALFAGVLCLPALGRPALLEPDEGRYAEIAREMVLSGDYVTPRNDWVRYFEKPPLVYWTMAASIKLLGRNEFAVRLPAAVFSIGEVVITGALGEALFGPAVGMLGAIALALSPLFLGFARFATLDPALAFFVTAALGAFWIASEAGDFSRGVGRNWSLLAAGLLALGTLAKGPVAVALGGGVALAFVLGRGRGRDLMKFPWLGAIILYCAIVAPWFVSAARRNPGFLEFFFVHEHLQRYLGSTEHGWGPYFLVIAACAGTWPWLYFTIDGAFYLWRGRRADDAQARRALKFLLLWFGLVLIFFSIPRSKLGSYVLPGIPPLAILAGCGLSRLIEGETPRKFLTWFALINLAAGAAMIAVLAVLGNRTGPSLVVDGAMVALAVLTLAVVPGLATLAGYRRAAVGVIVVSMMVAGGAAAKAREDGASYFSYRRLAYAVTPYLAPGCVFASYRHLVQSLPFYTGSREALVGYRGELEPFSRSPDASPSFVADLASLERIWSSSGCAVLIVNLRDLPAVTRVLKPPPSIIGCEGKKIALSNQPSNSPPALFDCHGSLNAAHQGRR